MKRHLLNCYRDNRNVTLGMNTRMDDLGIVQVVADRIIRQGSIVPEL